LILDAKDRIYSTIFWDIVDRLFSVCSGNVTVSIMYTNKNFKNEMQNCIIIIIIILCKIISYNI